MFGRSNCVKGGPPRIKYATPKLECERSGARSCGAGLLNRQPTVSDKRPRPLASPGRNYSSNLEAIHSNRNPPRTEVRDAPDTLQRWRAKQISRIGNFLP